MKIVVITEIWTGTLRLHPNDGRRLLNRNVQNEKSFLKSGRTRHHCKDCAWCVHFDLTEWIMQFC